MDYKGILSVDRKSFDVIDLRLTLPRPADRAGKGAASLQGRMHLCIDSSTKDSALFIPWVQDPSATKSGDLTFMPNVEKGVMKTVKFEGAHCIAFEENFEFGSAFPLTAVLTIVCDNLNSSEANVNQSLDKLLK